MKACGFNCKNAKPKDHAVDRWYSCLASSPIKDDELTSVERRKVEDCMGYGIFQEDDRYTGWFYDMCKYLKSHLDTNEETFRRDRSIVSRNDT